MTAIRAWILISAWLCGVGWLLSVVHQLNRAGYLVALAVTVVLFLIKRKLQPPPRGTRRLSWRRYYHRFKRPAPLFFLIILSLHVASRIMPGPWNGEMSAYRVSRVLHWIGEGGWHWIHTGDSRMNIAGCGYEWLYAPLILFTGTDRGMFLPNLVNYALLPGAVFMAFRRMQVRPRVAWWWMWVLSSGLCYALQAVSSVNDSLGTVYALAAVGFALQAWESKRVEDLALSLLAAGLLTGVKQTNLPLLLPWGIAVLPVLVLFRKRPVMMGAAALACLLVSAVPNTCLNLKYAGTWMGFPPRGQEQKFSWGNQQEPDSPFWGVAGNTFCLSAQNALPFFFPWATKWNSAMQEFVKTPFGSHFRSFEDFGRLSRSTTDASAGIGAGVVGLAIISGLALVACRKKQGNTAEPGNAYTAMQRRLLWWLRLAPWLSVLVFMAKVGAYQNARHLAPYYALCFPWLLVHPGFSRLVRQLWWRRLALLVIAATVAWVGFMRSRQLLPATVVVQYHARHPQAKFLSIFKDYYASMLAVQAQRTFTEGRVPPEETLIGYATFWGGAESGMWFPLGTRRVERVLPEDSAASLLSKGIRYVVLDESVLQNPPQTVEQWLNKYNATLVHEVAYPLDPGGPPGHLYLAKLLPPGN